MLPYDHTYNIFNATTTIPLTAAAAAAVIAAMCHFVHNIVCKLLTLFYCLSDLAV